MESKQLDDEPPKPLSLKLILRNSIQTLGGLFRSRDELSPDLIQTELKVNNNQEEIESSLLLYQWIAQFRKSYPRIPIDIEKLGRGTPDSVCTAYMLKLEESTKMIEQAKIIQLLPSTSQAAANQPIINQAQ